MLYYLLKSIRSRFYLICVNNDSMVSYWKWDSNALIPWPGFNPVLLSTVNLLHFLQRVRYTEKMKPDNNCNDIAYIFNMVNNETHVWQL